MEVKLSRTGVAVAASNTIQLFLFRVSSAATTSTISFTTKSRTHITTAGEGQNNVEWNYKQAAFSNHRSLLSPLHSFECQSEGRLSIVYQCRCDKEIRNGFFIRFHDRQQMYIPLFQGIRCPAHLYGEIGVSQKEACFSCNGKYVHDDLEFSAQDITPGSTLFCFSRLLGGGPPAKTPPSLKRKAPEATSGPRGGMGQFSSQIESGTQTQGTLPESRHNTFQQVPQTAGLNPQETCFLWIQNVDTKRKAPFEILLSEISEVYTVEALCHLVSRVERRSPRHCRGMADISLCDEKDNVQPFEIMIPEGAGFVRLFGAEPWTFTDYSLDDVLYIKVHSKSIFQKCSEKCLAMFRCPNFLKEHRDSEQKRTIYEFLRLPPKQYPERQLKSAQILSEGLRSQTQSGSVQSLRQERLSVAKTSLHPEGVLARPGRWISQIFPEKVFISDLDLSSDELDGTLSNGMKSLKTFLKLRKNGQCTLNFSPEHKDRYELESGARCYDSIRAFCSSKDSSGNNCTHQVTYKYSPIPKGGRFVPVNRNCPIFHMLVPKERCNLGHNCDEHETAHTVGKPTPGRPSVSEEQTSLAIFLLSSSFPLRMIVQAFGADPGNYAEFQNKMKQFRNAIGYKLRKDGTDDMDVLIQYFNSRSEIGHNGFICIERVPGSNQPRIYWQSAEQILFLKEGRATALSLDFVYKMIPGIGLAFGHLTAMSPSGHLVPVAQFLVKTESGQAIDWIFKKFDEVHEKFGLTCPSPVSFQCANLFCSKKKY
jgi:hypothetical protein